MAMRRSQQPLQRCTRPSRLAGLFFGAASYQEMIKAAHGRCLDQQAAPCHRQCLGDRLIQRLWPVPVHCFSIVPATASFDRSITGPRNPSVATLVKFEAKCFEYLLGSL